MSSKGKRILSCLYIVIIYYYLSLYNFILHVYLLYIILFYFLYVIFNHIIIILRGGSGSRNNDALQAWSINVRCHRLDKLPPQLDRGKSETEISSGQINCSARGPAKCRVNPGNTIDRLSFGISVDGQRLLPAPSWLGLAWLGLRPVVLVARAQHALGSNLSDLEMHATSAESTGSCVRCTHCPSRADSRCSPRNSSSIARAECIPMKRAS